MTHILMIAAENAALPGGKVGGIGDVVREVPTALAQRDCRVSVVTPSYGAFHKLPGAKKLQTLRIMFAGKHETVELYQLNQIGSDKRIQYYAVEHPLFSASGIGKIYCDDPPGRPFESDASKFALFCKALAEAIKSGVFADLEIIHLHDWHAAFLLILRQFDPQYRALQALRCVYSIHNLAIQGIRPFTGVESSLEGWYPQMKYDRKLLADPKWSDCLNPMACGIRLADAVHTVSPSYAEEILQPSDTDNGYYGGEGLEQDLRRANQENRLFGILNGCEYPPTSPPDIPDWPQLLAYMRDQVMIWSSRKTTMASADFIAYHSLQRLGQQRPSMLLTSVGRITDQKVSLLREPTSNGRPALHCLLEHLGDDRLLLMIGSGDPVFEQFLSESAARHANFVFLRGYSESLAQAFYQQGDLFFMPSSFEPCGISQMLSMRAGQPCLVHHVGGLRDTVTDRRTGFVFSGNNPTAQADALVATVAKAVTQFDKKTSTWGKMRKAASAARFDWANSIDAYLTLLYGKS